MYVKVKTDKNGLKKEKKKKTRKQARIELK